MGPKYYGVLVDFASILAKRKGFTSKRRVPDGKVTALFGHPEDLDAFEEHYANTHVPLVKKIPNLQRFEAAKIVATPDGSELPYYRMGEMYFEDVEQMQISLASDEGQAASADFQDFATGGVTIFISEINA
jgi:uncharacterized protein (TIGR02118 family)